MLINGTPSRMIPLNLQLFAEGDPIDPTPAPVDPTPNLTDPTPPQDPVPTDPTPTPEPQKFKVKFNHGEQEIAYDDAVPLIQKGMNYEKAIERERQVARDAYIAEQGFEWNGEPITTEQQYKEALREQEIRQQYEKRDLPPEVIEELVESRKFREQTKAEQQTKAVEAKQNADSMAFIEAYPDVKAEDIPAAVWQEVDKGRSLVDAYAKHENQLLKEKVSKLEQSLGIKAKNEENALTSTGSVTGQGNVPTGHFSREQVEKMSQSEVSKNYDAIMEAMKHW